MASITKNKDGRRTIQFMAKDGKRRSLRLGKVSQKQATAVKVHVERLVAASITGHSVDDDTSRWIAQLDGTLLKRLVAVGLIESTEEAKDSVPGTIQAFLDHYIKTFGPTVKPSTVTTWKQARRLLLEFFAPSTELDSINEGRAVEFRNYLLNRENLRVGGKLSESTIRRRCGCLRQIFNHAVELELIARNPWLSKRIPKTLPRPQQKYHVRPDLANRISDHLPHAQWRLLFALARWGGLRVPSEPRRLRWQDVDWESSRIVVHSPKTEHHDGHDRRTIPIFPELLGPLREAWEAAEPGDELVLPFMQGKTDTAFRKPLLRAIEKCGVEPWDKLFTSLRATRDTELRETFPSHVVDAWIGHDEGVAKRNYLQITDQH
ncbi:MAG: phage integrase SAM-like domain-containing protein, partial [Planctomycetales bacterium]|nr:phage integrase SAM-like domain-containing protein [Planctomycetales bacterium]